jgi:hypothetical protein
LLYWLLLLISFIIDYYIIADYWWCWLLTLLRWYWLFSIDIIDIH